MTLSVRLLTVPLLLAYAGSAWASGDPRALVLGALCVMVLHLLSVTIVLATREVPWRLRALFAAGYLAIMCAWWYGWYVAYTGAYAVRMGFDPFWLVVAVPLCVAIAGRMLMVRIGKSKNLFRSG